MDKNGCNWCGGKSIFSHFYEIDDGLNPVKKQAAYKCSNPKCPGGCDHTNIGSDWVCKNCGREDC